MGLLDGKKGIVYGLRNERSAAWGIAKSLAREGATFALTFLGEREEKDVRKLAPQLGENTVPLIAPCDLTKPDQVTALHEQLKETFGTLDFIVHSVAFAKGLDGRLVDVSPEDFAISMQVSVYTLVTAVKAAEPLLAPNASVVTLTYLGGERVVPNYNTAGIAKAALESTVRYLANDLGPQGVRVNAISAGPMMTLSARGIKGFVDMYKFSGEVSPLRHSTHIDEVGDATAFLVSSWARGITGSLLYVDSGYHIVGMPVHGGKESREGEA
ncbi:MAG: enoyl-ACP reductase [Capsulimonadales bacterium]|nr:enoyl-ACP reductase [Capsulimonadales bacterium]